MVWHSPESGPRPAGPIIQESRDVGAPGDWIAGLLTVLGLVLVFMVLLLDGSRSYWDQLPSGPDDAVRFVRLADLLGGQGWFDDTLSRMGRPDGLVMHWARLADLPVGMVSALLSPAVGPERALWLAGLIWPPALFLLLAAIVFSLVEETSGERLFAVAAVVLVFSHFGIAEFVPGRIDHHGLGIVIIGLMCLCLIRAGRLPKWAALAGGCAAIGPAISLELLPFSAVGIGVIALAWLSGRPSTTLQLRWFGAAMIAATVVATLIEVELARIVEGACDAWSGGHAAVFVYTGSVFLVLSSRDRSGAGWVLRAGMLSLAGAGGLALALGLLGECAINPMAGVPDDVMAGWHDRVVEIRPLLTALFQQPGVVGPKALPVLMALLGASIAIVVDRQRRSAWAILFAFIVMGVALSILHQRNMRFLLPFVPVVAAWAFTRIRRSGSLPAGWARSGVSVLSVVLFSGFLLAIVSLPFDSGHAKPEPMGRWDQQAAAPDKYFCYSRPAYDSLSDLPKGLVLSSIDLGSYVLYHTDHRVVTGPYHRNTDGLRAALDIWRSRVTEEGALDPQAARLLKDWGIDYLHLCASAEATYLPSLESSGLYRRLVEGDIPDGLVPVAADRANRVLVFKVEPSP